MAQTVSPYVTIVDPFGVDFESSGALLVSAGFALERVAPGGGSVFTVRSGNYTGRGVTVRSSDGSAYASNNFFGRLERITPANSVGAYLSPDPGGTYDTQFDASDNGFVSIFAGSLLRTAAGCTNGCGYTVFATPTNPAGMFAAANGDLYVASGTQILRYANAFTCTAPCTPTVFATVNAGARGLVFDPNSNAFYVASGAAGGNTIQKITTGGVVTTFATVAGGGLEGMTLGPDNKLYVAAPDLDRVVSVTLPAIVAPTPVPTLTEWAMILLGLLLAGFATTRLQRPRATAALM